MEEDIKSLETRVTSLEKTNQRVLNTSFVTVLLANTDAATDANYTHFFTATKPCFVKSITEVHATKGTDGSAVTLQVERLTSTTAPGSGTGLLTSEFNLKGDINTVQYGGLRTGNPLISQTGLNVGDRLSLKKTGTLTAVASLLVTVELAYYN